MNIFDKSLKQKTEFLLQECLWNQKGSNFNRAWTWAKTTTNTEVPILESSKTHSHSLYEAADILSWLFQDVQSTGTAPTDCSNLTSSFTTELTISSFLLYPQVCTGVLQEQYERSRQGQLFQQLCTALFAYLVFLPTQTES